MHEKGWFNLFMRHGSDKLEIIQNNLLFMCNNSIYTLVRKAVIEGFSHFDVSVLLYIL